MEGRKPDQFKHCGVSLSTDQLSSFCRKTTLTKHFRRWHTDEETSSEEGSDGDIDNGMFEGALRQSRYYGDLWPLPGQTAQPPRPLSFQPLVSRPRSTESIQADRTTSASPLSGPSAANPAMASYDFLRVRTGIPSDQILVQTAVPSSFGNVSVSSQYTSENGIGTWNSPMDTKAASSSFSEYSPTPSSAQSNPVYFNESTSPSYSLQTSNLALNETMQYPRESVTPLPNTSNHLGEGVPQGSIQPHAYSLGPTSTPEQTMQFSPDPHAIPQPPQVPTMLANFNVTNQYTTSNNHPQYYGPAPDWYCNIKPEDSWPGVLPNDYYWG